MEVWDGVLSSVGAQYMDTSGCQVSDMEDIVFEQEDSDLNSDAVFRPGLETPCSTSTFNDFDIGPMVENPILIAKEQGKENSHHLPKTPVFERPVLRRNYPFGTKILKVPHYFYGNLSGKYITKLLCL